MVNIGRQDLVRAGHDQDSEQNGGNFGGRRGVFSQMFHMLILGNNKVSAF